MLVVCCIMFQQVAVLQCVAASRCCFPSLRERSFWFLSKSSSLPVTLDMLFIFRPTSLKLQSRFFFQFLISASKSLCNSDSEAFFINFEGPGEFRLSHGHIAPHSGWSAQYTPLWHWHTYTQTHTHTQPHTPTRTHIQFRRLLLSSKKAQAWARNINMYIHASVCVCVYIYNNHGFYCMQSQE